MMRLMTPHALLAGLALFLVGAGVFSDVGVGVGAVSEAEGGGGGRALKKGRGGGAEPKFETPYKPANRHQHDWDTFDEEGESPTRRKRAPKKTGRMVAEEKYRFEMEKRKKMDRRTRKARRAGNEGEWRGEGGKKRMRKVRRAGKEGEWRGEGERKRMRKVRRAGKEGEPRNEGVRRRQKKERRAEKEGRREGREQGGKDTKDGRRASGKVKFSRRKQQLKKNPENKKEIKKTPKKSKKVSGTTPRKVATKPKQAKDKKEKDKKKKNKDKKEKGSGEETYVLGEVTTKFASKSKGKCIATDAILGKDSVVVYTTNQKKRSKCKITIRGKKGVKLTMQCSRFSLASSGCDAEVLQVVDKGSKETTKFCQNDNPGDTFTVSTGNQIQLKYKKKKFRKKDGDSSLGFVCKVAVEDSTQADLLLGNEADCGKAFDVQVGQSAVVASTASRGTCSISLNGKSGSVLSIDCPHLQFGRKCRAEDLFVQDRIDYTAFRLCKGSTELPFTVTTSQMVLIYTRDKATNWGDFVCRVTAVDWWETSEGNDNFEGPGYSSRGAYPYPHTSCPDKASFGGADAECRSVCRSDEDCPALQYCCVSECDRRCVTPQMTDTGDDCGCSVSFLPMTWPSSPSYDSGEVNIRVVNFIWQSVKDSFSPSMEVHLLDEDFRTTGIGQVDDLCQLENILQFEFRTKGFDLFKKPHRNLIVIGDSVDFFTRVSEAGALGEIFESVCAVVVGNVTLSDNLLSQFASTASPGEPCVWRADSYDQLGDLKPEVEVVIDDGSCLCPGETKDQSACAGPGENCVLDEDCGLRGDCVNGVCRERPCYVPDSYDPESDINYDYYVEDYYNYYGDYNYYSGYDVGYYFEYDYHYSDGVSNRMEQRKEPLTKLSQELKSKADVRDLSSLFQGCCSRGRMLCSGVPAVCVSPDAVCDGTADCINGEDETPEACEKRVCGEGRFQCSSGECVSRRKVCNAEVDCPDGSDEFCRNFTDCPAPRSHYCSSGECIGLHQICDGELDCLSGEDELSCQCPNFKCLSGECLSPFDECDGRRDCKDGSDEHCAPPNGDPCPPSRPFPCNDGECIYDFLLCDGYEHCTDGSDEDLKVCATSDCFTCDSGECINPRLRCDGVDDCEDGSDENDCRPFECPEDSFHCTSGECLDTDVVCNGREECRDGSDEASCTSSSCPMSRPLFCSSGECISFWQACNGNFDCRDRSDESRCPDIPCPPHRDFRCAAGQCLDLFFDPQCDGRESCADGSDEASCDSFQCPADRSYKCDSGECLYDFDYECDGDRDCKDGSDENNCDITGPCPESDDFRCSSGECVWNDNRCNGRIDCVDGSDETDCQTFTCPENRPFQCGSGECLYEFDVCDGRIDCKDGDDESNCKDIECYGDGINCGSGECIYSWNRCDGYPDCRDGSDEANCDEFTCPAIRPFHCASRECRRPYHQCDGFVQCADGSDEVNCANFTCPEYRPFKCASGICITIYQVCNGFDDCGDGSDEVDCQDFKCPPETAYQCLEGNCIPVRFVCDGKRNCLGGGDEEDCENYEVKCPKKFKCEADNRCFSLSWVCDDFEDCSDGSDEENCN